MRQIRAKLNWYKITWKWHRNTSIRDLLKDSYFGSHKGNVKTVIGNSSNPSSHGERAKAARFYFATIKNNNFVKSCRRVILMARIWIKRRLSIQTNIHSNYRKVKIHKILKFGKGHNNYTVTSCGDAKIYWVQLTSSSNQAASHRFKKFNLFLYKEQICRFHSLCPAILHNYSESSLNQSSSHSTTCWGQLQTLLQ